MFGSYSSFSAMSASQMTTPIDIGGTRSTVCAFPSWPRGNSLAAPAYSTSSSYLSDEDLLDDFDDGATTSSGSSSRSSSNASSISPPQGWRQAQLPYALPEDLHKPSAADDEELEVLQRERQAERQAYQRELLHAVLVEKERRKQAARKQKKTRKSAKLAAIVEA